MPLLRGRRLGGILSCSSLADKIDNPSNDPSDVASASSSSSRTTSSKKASKSPPKTPIGSFEDCFCQKHACGLASRCGRR